MLRLRCARVVFGQLCFNEVTQTLASLPAETNVEC